jgi:hypothetical protein
VDFVFFAHNLISFRFVSFGWKNSTWFVRREKGSGFARENAEAATKTSGLTGAWIQPDMNILSVSWSFQLTGGHRDVRNNYRVALSPTLIQILNALAALSIPMSMQISLFGQTWPIQKNEPFCQDGENECHQNVGGVHGSPCAAATT